MATRGSARCLLREDELGVIAPGRLADLMILNVSGPRYAVRPHPVPAIGLPAGPGDVEMVIVDGRVVLDRGEFTIMAERYRTDTIYAAAKKRQSAAFRQGDPERNRRYQRTYYERHREHISTQRAEMGWTRLWQATHPENRRAMKHAGRRACWPQQRSQ